MRATRRALAVAAGVLLLCASAVGQPRIRAARAVAEWRWGPVCDGHVSVFNAPLRPPLIAIALWDRTPAGYRNCSVTYSTTYPWAWWSLCRATVHEYGHLAGHGHASNPLAVMYPWTRRPWPPCGPDHDHARLGRGR